MTTRFRLRHYANEVDSHRHDHHQLVLPQAGLLELDIEGRGGRVDPAKAAFIAQGERHAFRAHGPNAFVVLDLVARGGSDDGTLPRHRFPAITPHVRQLLAGLGAHMPQPAAAITTWTTLLLQALRDTTPFDGLAAAHALLESEPARPFDMHWLAQLSGASRAQFYRRFGARYGQPPATVQRAARLRQAVERLRDRDQSIAHIASEVGYSEHSALTRALRRQHGRPPRTLRGL